MGSKKLSQSGVILNYLAKRSGKFLPSGEEQELEAMRWLIYDNQKVNGFLGPYRFLRNWAKPAPDPAVLAFFKGRIDGSLAIINKRLEAQPFVLGDKPTIADVSLCRLSLLSGRGVRLRHRQGASGDRVMARADAGAAGLEAPVRSDARASAGGVVTLHPRDRYVLCMGLFFEFFSGRPRRYCAVSPPSIANSAPVTNADSSDSR